MHHMFNLFSTILSSYILCTHMIGIYPWATIGDIDISDSIWLQLYNNIIHVIYTSYYSQTIKKIPVKLPIESTTVTDYTDIDSNSNSSSNKQQPVIFAFKVYSRSKCPLGYSVIKELGPHKRSIHWVPEVQVYGKKALQLIE